MGGTAFQLSLTTVLGTLWLGVSLVLVVILLYRIPRGDFEDRYTWANWSLWGFLSLIVLSPIYYYLDPSVLTLSQTGYGGQPETLNYSFMLYSAHALGAGLLALMSLAKLEGAYLRPILGMIPLVMWGINLMTSVKIFQYVPKIPNYLPYLGITV